MGSELSSSSRAKTKRGEELGAGEDIMSSNMADKRQEKEKEAKSSNPLTAVVRKAGETLLGSRVEYCGFDISALPQEIIEHVLLFVPARDVVHCCALVCQQWLALARDQDLWRRKCVREGTFIPSLMGACAPDDFAVFYFKNPYQRNLLRNTHALNKEYWYKPGYVAPAIETTPAGANPIRDYVPEEEIGKGMTVKNWVTSYQFGSITQQVHLLKEGCSEHVLDQYRPHIYVSAWCAARFDCGAKFQLSVKLLGSNGEKIEEYEEEKVIISGDERRKWHKVEHTFTDYKAGVRSVKFQMGGVDTQFWAGNYGSKFTLPCLRFIFDNK